jgi:hypothetical protein
VCSLLYCSFPAVLNEVSELHCWRLYGLAVERLQAEAFALVGLRCEQMQLLARMNSLQRPPAC